MTKKRKRKKKDPSRRYTEGNWPKDRPENPCRVFAFDSDQGDLMQQILDALWASEEQPEYKCIWLPDVSAYEVPEDVIKGLPVKYTSYNCGGSLGIWLEQVDLSSELD